METSSRVRVEGCDYRTGTKRRKPRKITSSESEKG